MRMTSFYILYVTEYLVAVFMLVQVIPTIKMPRNSVTSMPNNLNFDLDLTLVYFVALFVSVPNFISTFIYLHKKREQQLYFVYGRSQSQNRVNAK